MPVWFRGATVAPSLALLGLLTVTACGGEGGKYAGNYKRDLYGEGEVQMKLSGDGTVELVLPSPRWAANPNRKGKGTFKGDTLVFPVDTAAAKCATQEARYVLGESDGNLTIAGVGLDNCGDRRAALNGAWKKG
jgi:hypothetical protein